MKQAVLFILLIANAALGDVRISGDHVFKAAQLRAMARTAASLDALQGSIYEAYTHEGYFAAAVTVDAGADTTITIRAGRRFSGAETEISGVDTAIVARIADWQDSQPVTAQYLAELNKAITRAYADAGYPFCQSRLASVDVLPAKLRLKFEINTGPRATFGSVSFTGLVVSKPSRLLDRMAFHGGEPYRELQLSRSAQRLAQLEYTRSLREPVVAHNTRTNAADITFAMRDERNLLIDGLIFLNADNSIGGSGDLNVRNLLGTGEQATLYWASLNAQSSDLALNVKLPFVGGYPFDVALGLSQSDRDSAFVSAKIEAGLQFYLNDRFRAGTAFAWEKITPEEGQTTPSARIVGVRLTTSFDRRDDIRNTRRGVLISTEFGSNYRRAFSAASEVSTGYATLLRASLEFWQPASRRWVLYQRMAPFQVRSDFDPIPVEQLIDVGGPRSVRGYRERSFRADLGVVSATELRWLGSDDFLARVFCDNAYIETESGARKLTGFGAGVTLATTTGRFRLDFSVGEEKQLDRMLVHFGFETGL